MYNRTMYVFYYFSTSDLLSFIIPNTDKHEFSCIWKWIRCCNDVMNNVDCVIKRDVYLQKCIHGLKISVGYQFCSKISVVYNALNDTCMHIEYDNISTAGVEIARNVFKYHKSHDLAKRG